MTTPAPRRGPGLLVFLPLVLFAVLAGLFYVRLYAGDPSEIPSVLIGRPAPEFTLPPVAGLSRNGAPVPGLTRADLIGKVSVVNVFASWCVPCRDEHPFLLTLAEDKRFALFGLNYKDSADNAVRFLGALGNPYAAVGADGNGRVGIDWGVYGVPETFVIDRSGTIVYKHIGPLSQQSVAEKLMPEIEKALAAGSS